jgi:hypothetical protein
MDGESERRADQQRGDAECDAHAEGDNAGVGRREIALCGQSGQSGQHGKVPPGGPAATGRL